jgi:TnpA family transposase
MILEVIRTKRAIFCVTSCGPETSNEFPNSLWQGGDIASNRWNEQEMSALCSHIVQAAMVYVDTLMIRDVPAEEERMRRSHPRLIGA